MNYKGDFLEIQCSMQGCLKKVRGSDVEILALLKNHLVEEHRVLETKGTICPFCNKDYARGYLKQHISTVHLYSTDQNTGRKKQYKNTCKFDESYLYWCKKCERKFSSNSQWMQHVRSHMKLTYETQRVRQKNNKILKKHVNDEANFVTSVIEKSTVKRKIHEPGPACPGLVLNLNNKSVFEPTQKHLGIQISEVHYTNANREIVSVNSAKKDEVIVVDTESEEDICTSEGKEIELDCDLVLVNDESKDVEQEKLVQEIEQFMQEENLLGELEEEVGSMKRLRKKLRKLRSKTQNASESVDSSDSEVL